MKTTKRFLLTTAIACMMAIPAISDARGPVGNVPNSATQSQGCAANPFCSQATTGCICPSAVLSMPYQELSTAEQDGLIFMREEEKLARDVYQAMYEKWGVVIFSKITQSETKHTEAIKALIDKYQLADPVGSNTVGVFTNPTLQALYGELVAKGNISLIDAFTIGAMIEELDIADLKSRIASADNDDIKAVYNNLMRGSGNHLRAFVSQLIAYGATYTPKYIAQAEYDDIIATAQGGIGRGMGQGCGGGCRRMAQP